MQSATKRQPTSTSLQPLRYSQDTLDLLVNSRKIQRKDFDIIYSFRGRKYRLEAFKPIWFMVYAIGYILTGFSLYLFCMTMFVMM